MSEKLNSKPQQTGGVVNEDFIQAMAAANLSFWSTRFEAMMGDVAVIEEKALDLILNPGANFDERLRELHEVAVKLRRRLEVTGKALLEHISVAAEDDPEWEQEVRDDLDRALGLEF